METHSYLNLPNLGVQQAQLQQANNRLQQMKADYINPKDADHRKLKEAAQNFEAIFIKQMLDAMEKTIDRENSLLSGGSAEGYFRDMMYDEIAQNMSQRLGGSGFGLAETIYKQMAEHVEETPLAPTEGTLQMGQENEE